MSVPEFLSQPVWQRLSFTLLHFLWQGLAVAVLVAVLVKLLRLKQGNPRYTGYLLAFMVMMACPLVTFLLIDTSASLSSVSLISPDLEGFTETTVETVGHSPPPAEIISLETATPALETDAPSPDVRTTVPAATAVPLQRRISEYLHASLPWALAGWMAGVLVVSTRLLLGFVGVYRWRRRLEPLSQDLGRRVTLLSRKLGMGDFSRVLISPSALQAIAVGYLRPMVLLPASMVTQMPPEMLEAVIAHELAHIRRFDLWVNLLQRVVETLLFYHPAVWWLSSRLRKERELCCDELAVGATGERLTYASALEIMGRARILARQPALAAGFGHDDMPILSRVRYVLGLAPRPQDSRFWLAGVVTIMLLAALAIPTTLVLTRRTAGAERDVEHGLFGMLADPKVNDEGQQILRKFAVVNRYWLVGPPAVIKNYSYDYKSRNFWGEEVRDEKISVANTGDGRIFKPGTNYEYTHYPILRRLAANPSAALVTRMEKDNRTTRVHFIYNGLSERRDKDNVERDEPAVASKAGSLLLDSEKMVPLMLKTSTKEVTFHDYISAGDGRYVPLRISRGPDFDLKYRLYEPGLWLSARGTTTRMYYAWINSISNVRINGRRAEKADAALVEVAEIPKADKVSRPMRNAGERFINLVLGKESMALDGKAVRWETIWEHLAEIRDPRQVGLHLVVPEEIGAERLREAKTLVSFLSRQFKFGYLSGIGDRALKENHFPKKFFFAAPFEFGKKIGFWQQAGGGKFKQKYYRTKEGWSNDPNQTHMEWATIYLTGIYFDKSLAGDEVKGYLGITTQSIPISKFRVTVQLLDEEGEILAEDSTETGGDGSILSGCVLTGFGEHPFSLGRWEDAARATSFEIIVEPVPDVPADSEWSMGEPEEDITGELANLLSELKDDDHLKRAEAAWRLGELKDSRAVEGLVRTLKDEDVGVSVAAARALGKISDSRATIPLHEMHRDQKYEPYVAAILALGEIGGRDAQWRIAEALRDEVPHPEVRKIAAQTLANMGWEPSKKHERIRYLMALEKWDEAIAAGFAAAMEVGTNHVKGLFEKGVPIILPLKMCKEQNLKILPYPTIEFSRPYTKIRAEVGVRHLSWPETKWKVEIELIGRPLGSSEERILKVVEGTFSSSGTIEKYAGVQEQKIRFSFGREIQSDNVTHFRVSIEETEAKGPGEPNEPEDVGPAESMVEKAYESAQEKGERILEQMAEVNRHWIFGPTDYVRNYSYDFITTEREQDCSVTKKTERIEISDPYAVDRTFRQGITYYSVLHKLLSEPSSAVITAIRERDEHIQLDFAFEEPVMVECGNGLSKTTGRYFSGLVHTGHISIDAEKMVADRVRTNLFEEEFEDYVPVGKGHYVPERVEVERQMDFHRRFRFEWRFEVRGTGLWLFRHGELRPSDGRDDHEVSIDNVEINDPAISETKVPTSDVTLEESPLAASGVAGEKHDGEAEGTNDRAVGSSAADERLPGRDIPVKWAISSPQFAFAAVCGAVDEADTELDSSGIVNAVGTFKPVQILSGSEAIGSPFKLSYSFHSPDFDSKHSRSVIRKGERVIWIVHRRGPEGYFGVKALSETRENRSIVMRLCRMTETINAYWQAIVGGDLEKVRESIENDPNLVSAVDARGKSGSGLPALGLAIRHGHTEIVELLLSKGADANRRLPHRQTGPLHAAARKGRADLVELLVAHGADVNGRKNDFQFPPLCYATTAEAAETLIANGADVNLRDHHRMTPLHSIARLGNTEAVEVLVRHGADVDAVDASGRTPLHRAVDWGHIQTAARLLAMGADIDSKDGRSTPLNRAIRSRDGRGNREMAAFLVSQGARRTIGDLAWLGDIGRLRDYLPKHPGSANKREHGEPILFAAIRQGHSATAELLIDSGASLDVRDRFEEPPLHVAAYAGHRLMVEMLLAKGADVNQKGPYGELALHWAVAKGHAEVVEVLLGAGCDVNARAEKQRVNMDTMTEKDADAVQEWSRFLADCEAQRQAEIVGSGLQIMGPLQLAFAAGDSPLHVASQWGHEEITQALLAKGADANIKNRWDQTPLHYASVFYHKKVVELLLDAGADVNVEDKNGRSPLSLALLPRGLERNKIAELLRARGASVRPENRNKVGSLAWGGIPVKGLQARLAVKSIAEKREPRVALTFELRNVSNKPIRILRLSEKKRFWGFCLPLEVRVAEKTLTYQGPVLTPPPPPGRSSYIDLSPGAVDSAEAVMVPGYWGLEDPFEAELTFVFQNSRDSEHCEYDNEERKWLSITGLWTGKVRSNTVELDKTILGMTAASPTMKADAKVEIDKRKAPNGLRWVDQDSGEILFDIGDIVRFDWSKQIFELARSAAMDFTTRLIDLDRGFEVQLGKDTVYSGSLVSVFSSRSYRHPVIRFPKSRNGLRPPLFAIDGGYPRDFSTNELRFSELLEKALQQADVLGQIDVNNPPSPIEKVAHGWFGEKNGLRAYVEVFPETFRLFRSLRVHIHLTGPNYLNEGHVVDVKATLVSGKGKSKFSTSKTFPFDGGGWKNTHVLEMDPWGPAREWTSGSVKPGRAELSIEVFTKKILDASTKQYSDPIDHVKTAAMNVNILPGRRLLPELPNEPYKVDFVMIAANSIKGRLVDKEGRPLAGKQLSLTGEGSYRGTSALAGIETDEDGRFEVTEVPPKIFWFEYRYERRKQIKTVPISFSEPGEYDVVLVYAEHEHGPPTLEVEEAELRRTGMPDANRDMPKICTLSDKALMSLDVHGGSTARVIDKRDTPGAGVEFDIYFPPGGYSLSYVSSRTSGKGTLTHIDLNEYIGYALKFSLVDIKSSTPDANRARLGVGANIGSPGRYRPAFIKLAGDKEPVVSSTGFEASQMRSLDYLGFTAYLLPKEISNTDGLTITIKIEAVPGAHKIEPKKDMPDFSVVPGAQADAITKETEATSVDDGDKGPVADDRPSLPVTLVSAEKKEGVSSYHWRIMRESACRLHLGWFSYYHKEIYDYAGWGTAEPKAGHVDIKITIRRENGFFRLIHEYRQDKSDKPIRKEDRIELPENCELDESHLAEPIILTNARNQTLWQARVIHIHEHGTQKRFTVRFIVRALKAGESTDTFEPPFDPLGIPPEVGAQETSSSESSTEPEDQDVQSKGQELLTRMAQVNRYWLVAPPPEVKNYSYDFVLSDKEPESIETIQISDPAHVFRNFRQGVTYFSVLHKLVSDPASAVISGIQQTDETIRLDFTLKDPLDIESGNGLGHSYLGYFIGPVKEGTLWLDAERMVPVRTQDEWFEEDLSQYVEAGQDHYVPLAIRVAHKETHYDWKFCWHEPGLWLFEEAYYGQDQDGKARRVARLENVKINDPSIHETKVPSSGLEHLPSIVEAKQTGNEGGEKGFALTTRTDDDLIIQAAAEEGRIRFDIAGQFRLEPRERLHVPLVAIPKDPEIWTEKQEQLKTVGRQLLSACGEFVRPRTVRLKNREHEADVRVGFAFRGEENPARRIRLTLELKDAGGNILMAFAGESADQRIYARQYNEAHPKFRFRLSGANSERFEFDAGLLEKLGQVTVTFEEEVLTTSGTESEAGGQPVQARGRREYGIEHAVVISEDFRSEYAQAILRTAAAARKVAVEQFGFDMPETIRISAERDCNQATRLFNDGQDRLYLSVRGKRDLRRPDRSGIFNIYGICHEIGHLAMYRVVRDHSWLTSTAAEGWAHYIGSRIVDGVYDLEGERLWPDRYDYSADGMRRLEAQLAEPEADDTVQAAGLWMELTEIVGDEGISTIFEDWARVEVDASNPGKTIRGAMGAINNLRLSGWWDRAEPIFVFERPGSGFAPRTAEPYDLTGYPIELAHDDGQQEGKKSIAGSGHAVRFDVQGDGWYLTEVVIYGSRYGYPAAPEEDFHVWLCDTDFDLIADFPQPYSSFRRGQPQWVNVPTEPTSVPSEFIVCVGFNPTATKGVYVGMDGEASGNSFTGLPGRKGRKLDTGDWMIRASLDQLKTADALRLPK